MATVIVSLVVFGAVAFVIGKGIYNRVHRKGGGCSCGGGCSGCPGSCLCHPEK
ncbi:FeoB-associated Cys-rich membrane protein [Subdoligranulum sp. DSM 109015]|uniref:FeoB-associated Cys-rich membrane protein n=1 Tax=Gemmiger gallinarum TaxID=2779354 RepID=A0ABR9R386_9FIRM|nr:FeoB-associated Cys-rich membrane protein [Gemmiger gallinarum]MBE5037610.1 FeoB-associated Cys-rich membrane protein [Gemmiger gallinarum]